MKGAFVVLEGPEGGGKTSQARALADGLEEAGYQTVLTREPGGTQLGDTIRDVVLPVSSIVISSRSEVLLYCASRAQLVEEVIKPALEQGKIVISDRFGYSTIAYQGYGRGLDVPAVSDVVSFATGGLEPDLLSSWTYPQRSDWRGNKGWSFPATLRSGTASNRRRWPSTSGCVRATWRW